MWLVCASNANFVLHSERHPRPSLHTPLQQDRMLLPKQKCCWNFCLFHWLTPLAWAVVHTDRAVELMETMRASDGGILMEICSQFLIFPSNTTFFLPATTKTVHSSSCLLTSLRSSTNCSLLATLLVLLRQGIAVKKLWKRRTASQMIQSI